MILHRKEEVHLKSQLNSRRRKHRCQHRRIEQTRRRHILGKFLISPGPRLKNRQRHQSNQIDVQKLMVSNHSINAVQQDATEKLNETIKLDKLESLERGSHGSSSFT